LHIAQQMPLPLTISCSSKSRLVLTFLVLPFWYQLTWVVPDKFQKSSKTVVCVCVCDFAADEFIGHRQEWRCSLFINHFFSSCFTTSYSQNSLFAL